MSERVPAAGRLRRLGSSLPDDGLPVSGGHRRARWASSSSRDWSTRARSPCTGASTAARRWPRRKSSTKTTRRRRSTSSSRCRRRAARARRVACPRSPGRDVSVLIWTTTPWTIPSNLAIAFHPEIRLRAYDVDGRAVIVAEALAPSGSPRSPGRTLRRAARDGSRARTLERIRFQHPLYERESLGVLGDYVTLEQGTGAVHTAPGHGSDDFTTGVQLRPRDLRARRSGRTLSRRRSSCSAGSGCSTRTRRSSRRSPSAGGSGTASPSGTRIRIAGVATIR